jgi:hypothetical protein
MLNQTLLISDLEQVIDFQVTEALNVDGTTLLVCFVIEVRVNCLYLIVLFEDKDLLTIT